MLGGAGEGVERASRRRYGAFLFRLVSFRFISIVSVFRLTLSRWPACRVKNVSITRHIWWARCSPGFELDIVEGGWNGTGLGHVASRQLLPAVHYAALPMYRERSVTLWKYAHTHHIALLDHFHVGRVAHGIISSQCGVTFFISFSCSLSCSVSFSFAVATPTPFLSLSLSPFARLVIQVTNISKTIYSTAPWPVKPPHASGKRSKSELKRKKSDNNNGEQSLGTTPSQQRTALCCAALCSALLCSVVSWCFPSGIRKPTCLAR